MYSPTIERGIPVPATHNGRYQFNGKIIAGMISQLRYGDSIFVPCDGFTQINRRRALVWGYAKARDMTIRTEERTEHGITGFRFWRVG